PLQMPPTSVQTPPQMQALASSAPTMQALASSAPTQQAIAFHTPTQQAIARSGSVNTPGLPPKRGISRRTVFFSLAGVIVAGVAGGLWWEFKTPTSGLPGFAANSTWSGLANQYNNGTHYSIIMKVEKIDGVTFSGTMTYPDLGNSVTEIAGTIVDQFGDATEQSKWKAVPGFSVGEKGTALKFTENSVIKASPGFSIVLGVQYYASASVDGAIKGVWFDSAISTDPRGDYEMYK
ncbi:MAG: hypothetical protein ABI234_18810, partial [Ktedonobacteraceae bacterium]